MSRGRLSCAMVTIRDTAMFKFLPPDDQVSTSAELAARFDSLRHDRAQIERQVDQDRKFFTAKDVVQNDR